jgi:hypothetical protein
MQGVFGEHHQIHSRITAPGFADQVADHLGLHRHVAGGLDGRQLQLDQPDGDPRRRTIEPTKSAHDHSSREAMPDRAVDPNRRTESFRPCCPRVAELCLSGTGCRGRPDLNRPNRPRSGSA